MRRIMKKCLLFTGLIFMIGCKPTIKNDLDLVEVDQTTIGKHIKKLAKI